MNHLTLQPRATTIQRRSCTRGLVVALLLAASIVATTPGTSVSAASFEVTNLLDRGPGSLRDALLDLEAIGSPVSNTITFDSNLRGRIVQIRDLPPITRPVSIAGPGRDQVSVLAILDRHFSVEFATRQSFEMSGLTLVGGRGSNGAAIHATQAAVTLRDVALRSNVATGFGGAVFGQETSIEVIDSDISENEAELGGGAIAADEGVVITRSTLDANTTSGSGGAVLSEGGLVEITDSDLVGNSSADSGGAVFVAEGELSVQRSALVDNRVTVGGGGAISSESDGFVIDDSIFSGNHAAGDGGAIRAGSHNTGTSPRAEVEGSVFDANSSESGGGATSIIHNVPASFTGTVMSANSAPFGAAIDGADTTIVDSYVVDNTSEAGAIYSGGGPGRRASLTISASTVDSNAGGAALMFFTDALVERSTISNNVGQRAGAIELGGSDLIVDSATLADNRGDLFDGIYSPPPPDASPEILTSNVELRSTTLARNGVELASLGSLTMEHAAIDGPLNLGSNVLVSATNSMTSARIPADSSVIDSTSGIELHLGPLGDHGGGMRTVKPLGRSPLIDGGSDGPVTPVTDQRGAARTVGDATDVGAVELQRGEVPLLVPVEPGRILDTRVNGETADGAFAAGGRIGAGAMIRVRVAGRAGVDDEARAVAVNVTAIKPDGAGFVTAFPCGERPLASSINFAAGSAPIGNELVAGLDPDGHLCLFASTGVDLTADVVGFATTASRFHAVVPGRLLDTRPGQSTVDGISSGGGRRPAGSSVVLPVVGRAGVPSDAASAIVNVTAVGAAGVGFVTVHPCLEELPLASSLNYVAGVNRGNEIVAELSSAGELCIFTSAATHLTVDVVGWLPGLVDFEPVDPARLVDTRSGEMTVDGTLAGEGRIESDAVFRVPVAERAQVPRGATAAVINLTAVGASSVGYFTVWDCVSPQPLASSLNYASGVNGGNEVVAGLSAAGELCVYSFADTHLTIDVVGYLS